SPDQRDENTESFEELKLFLGDELGRTIPIVVMLNKRDLPNRMSREFLSKELFKQLPVRSYLNECTSRNYGEANESVTWKHSGRSSKRATR
ncbi:MAG: hypothetical protein ACW968_11495, partial [Candidatus Thorarchaeota archaeon]